MKIFDAKPNKHILRTSKLLFRMAIWEQATKPYNLENIGI